MRYLLILPATMIVVSGMIWWMARGGSAAPAQAQPAHDAGERESGQATVSRSQALAVSTPGAQAPTALDPILITPCTLVAIQEQNVSSQLDGLLAQVHVVLGQKVNKGDPLARLEDGKLRLQVQLLEIRAGSESGERIAQAMFDEADAKVKYAEKANEGGRLSVPELEYKLYLAQRERFAQEIKKAREDREEAGKELEKARLLLRMHQAHSVLHGEVTRVYKKEGEAVKQAETLFRIARTDRLSIEGFCKVQHASRLRPGMEVLVEPELQGAQAAELVGHTAAVTSLAISPDGRVVASASEDSTVRLWHWPSGRQLAVLSHPAAVLAVDIVQRGAKGVYLLATGCEDRRIRTWTCTEDGQADGPVLELEGHEAAVRCVRLDPAGNHCASGSDDRRIGWWDLTTGRRRCWVHQPGAWKQSAHQGAVTNLELGPDGVLVSTGTDNVHKVWQVDSSRSQLLRTHRGRSGDVARPGQSADGKYVLFDHGEELRMLNRDNGAVLATLRGSKHARFEEFAQFSPTGQLILSATSDGRLQLWRTRGAYEVRHYLIPRGAGAKCAVFAPDEQVFFTGGSDRAVRAWSVPPAREREPRQAVLTYVGSEIEQGTDLVRIQAEMDNPPESGRRLSPGTFVTLKVYPGKKVSGPFSPLFFSVSEGRKGS